MINKAKQYIENDDYEKAIKLARKRHSKMILLITLKFWIY